MITSICSHCFYTFTYFSLISFFILSSSSICSSENLYDFLDIIAKQLEIDKPTFLNLFKNPKESNVIKDEFSRICQFYRLALLMHTDGVLHENELIKINEIGINMGLNPYAMKRVLHLMKNAPDQTIDGAVLLAVFSEQHN